MDGPEACWNTSEMPLEWLYGQKIKIFAQKESLDFSEKIKIGKNRSKMGRHGLACTDLWQIFFSASNHVHNVPWGPQKWGFLEKNVIL